MVLPMFPLVSNYFVAIFKCQVHTFMMLNCLVLLPSQFGISLPKLVAISKVVKFEKHEKCVFHKLLILGEDFIR